MFLTRYRHALALVAAVLAAAFVVVGPSTPRIDERTSGDPDLAALVRQIAGDDRGHRVLHVSVITADSVRHAGIGSVDARVPDADTIMDLGSITKTFNGLLLADAVTRGEVRYSDRLDAHLTDLAGTPLGGVTLEDLAAHRAGVPPLPPGVLWRGLLTMPSAGNPYELSRADLLASVHDLALDKPGEFAYSNLGASLLGHALAEAAGSESWQSYVSQRLLTPLGMTRTTFAAREDQIPAGEFPGFTENGRRVTAWTSDAFAPAGAATFTTPADMTRYAQALLAGRAPGMAALDPRHPAGDSRIGLHWITSEVSGRQIVWHNGGVNGYRTILAVDPAAGRAVIVFGNTTRSVDAIGMRLVTDDSRPVAGPSLPIGGLIALGVSVMLLGTGAWGLLRGASRVGQAGGTADIVAAVALSAALGPWSYVPGWLWALIPALGAGVLVLGWTRGVTGLPQKHRVSTWISTVVSLVFVVGLLVLVL